MKKKWLRISIVIIVLLLLSNFFSVWINVLTEGLFRTYHYQTENGEFEFTTMPSKGRDVEMMERNFADFKKINPEYEELELFRTFKRNPLKFWNWYSYFTHEMYKFEYQNKVKSKTGESELGIPVIEQN